MSTFADVTREITSKIEEVAKDGDELWFRGHSSKQWSVYSTLHRYLLDVDKEFHISPDTKLLREEEKSLYLKFSAEAWPLLSESQRREWGIVFVMRHHGVPSRLIDWTSRFSGALYFAMQNRDQQGAAIYMLNPQRLNEISMGERALVFLEEQARKDLKLDTFAHHPCAMRSEEVRTIAVTPVLNNPRLVAQKGRFLLAGDSFKPLEHQFDSELVKKDILTKIVIEPPMFADAEIFLELSGVTEYGLFPDLDGLARQLRIDRQESFELARKMIREEEK